MEKKGEKVVVSGKLVEGYVPPVTLEMTGRKRGEERMMFDILDALKICCRPSRIYMMTNIGGTKGKEIFARLEKQELTTNKKKGRIFTVTLTEKGIQALKSGREFLRLIGELR